MISLPIKNNKFINMIRRSAAIRSKMFFEAVTMPSYIINFIMGIG